jgi:hypothetical protein
LWCRLWGTSVMGVLITVGQNYLRPNTENFRLEIVGVDIRYAYHITTSKGKTRKGRILLQSFEQKIKTGKVALASSNAQSFMGEPA